MKKTAKRLTAVLLVLCMLPALYLTAAAGASETENFLGGYSLIGDGAADMVSIALAQEGRTGREFGYDDQWCAYFVSDCARIAGQTAAIPAHGTCTYLYQNILNAGGTVTTHDPKPGDICFINWYGESAMRHVEIVYKVEGGMVYTVGGNSGGGSSYLTRVVKTHAPLDEKCILAIVRPAYGTAGNGSQPSQSAPAEPKPTEPKPTEPKPTEPPAPPREYTISFDDCGGRGGPEDLVQIHGVTLTLPRQIPLRKGYHFLYWRLESGQVYFPGGYLYRNRDTVLYACWCVNYPKVILKKCAAAIGGRQNALTIPCDSRYRLPFGIIWN